jgi:hypothetical protein
MFLILPLTFFAKSLEDSSQQDQFYASLTLI